MTHLSLSKDAPEFRRVQSVGSLAALPLLARLQREIAVEVSVERIDKIPRHRMIWRD